MENQNPQTVMPQHSANPSKTFLILIAIILLGAVGFGGYLFGVKNTQQSSSQLQYAITSTPRVIKSSPTSLVTSSTQWSEMQYEFTRGYAFDIKYPSDAQTWVYDGTNSALPISPFKQIFTKAIEFSSPSSINIKNSYNVEVGYSLVDPTLCYQTTCKDAIATITNTQTASISGVLAKKVDGTATNGGGTFITPTSAIEFYVIPYSKNFIILSGAGDIFVKMLASFKLIKY